MSNRNTLDTNQKMVIHRNMIERLCDPGVCPSIIGNCREQVSRTFLLEDDDMLAFLERLRRKLFSICNGSV
jgi:hypothetical protein